jgi:methyl-accepting chemotaxis protein
MKWLTHLKIKYKLTLVLLFPMIGLLYFSLLVVNDKYQIAREMDYTEDLAQMAVKTAELIHQLQLERLTSVQFFKHHEHHVEYQEGKQLAQEYLKTDKDINQLRNRAEKIKIPHWDTLAHLQQLSKIFEQIKQLRQAVQTHTKSKLQTIKDYGNINQVLIEFIKQIANLTSDKVIFTRELAYINFLAAKELAAQERSLLVNALTQKYFERGEFQQFVALVAQQEVYRRIIFMFLATEEQKQFFEQHVAGQFIEKTQNIRDMVYETANEGLLENVDPQFWAQMQTGKIELLREVETRLAKDLTDNTLSIQSQAYRDFMIAVIVVFIIVLIVSVLGFLVLKGMTTQLNQAVTVANAIADGNLNHQIDITVKDEIGQLLQAFAKMQQQLSTQIEQEINAVIQAAAIGDFQQRIDLQGKKGFFYRLSECINDIMNANQAMLEETMRIFSALARGDLTQLIENESRGAFEQLKNDANTTVLRLQEIITTIKKTTQIVNHAATEISQGNISLSQRTEQQAASLEETAASMEQMTSTVQQNADNSKYASQLAQSARDYAIQGGEVVNAAINAMTDINNRSQKITDIISVINEIAFQTNLLALNAAVEAARAGEQGRGFAVVASEVRNLAQRSATAAKEIKELIQDSVARVEEGTKLANQSGETLEQIVTAIKKVTDLIAEIASASQEQSSGIHQVNKAVAQLDETTQQNASMVQQVATASSTMKEQISTLSEQIAFFKVGYIEEQPKTSKKSLFQPRDPNTRIPTPSKHHYSDEDDEEWQDF